MLTALWRMLMTLFARRVRKALERWDEPEIISVSTYPETFKRWWDEQVAEHGKPEVSLRVDEPVMEQPSLPPIPSSAQLNREYEELFCACGHNIVRHLNGGECIGMHGEKPCQCPRFFGNEYE